MRRFDVFKMDDIVDKLLQAKVLNSSLIQKVFVYTKKLQSAPNNSELWDKISQILWLHMQSGVLKIDDQLLCATCFYMVISLTRREEFYLKEVVQMIQREVDHRKSDVLINSKTTMVVSLMYGIFQSTFFTTNSITDEASLKTLLELTFNLLVEMAYDYSRNTFVVFKTISCFKRVCETKLQDYLFTTSNTVKLLNLVNHNWENPITGVRDLNKIIFRTIISLTENSDYQAILNEVNDFYWNKAKYLMLSEMIGQNNANIANGEDHSNWLIGLTGSLNKPGLVSAGTDMYFAILKRLHTEDDWIQMFLPTITNILSGDSIKAIENFVNYWCLTTFKKFPSLIKEFEKIFENTEDINKKLYNTLHILKQANKLGFISKHWNSPREHKLLETMVLLGIENGNESVRMAAFDIVCEFQSKTLPSELEYELVLNYIKNNINSDCTVLRLGMLNNLKHFLMQIHSVFITLSKSGLVPDIQNLKSFLKALQELVILNINAKGNYQRKITSVKLCSVIWECTIQMKLKKSPMKHSDSTLLKMLDENELWLLSDEVFINKLITFLQDPSDDIRENIVNLLLNYYSQFLKQSDLFNHVVEEALNTIGGKFFYEISCGQSMFKLIISILLKEKLKRGTFKTVEDVFTFASNELINEHDLKRDILESIQCGKQLHSFMDILLVVLDVSYHKDYEVMMSDQEILDLLKCLEDISDHFAVEENSSSSDFSKMNDMVQQIIDNSGFSINDDEDMTKISGVHQMVLNCMWLNVKACSDLAAIMIRHCNQVTYVERFLLIITHVLESSRHKGAIESAGAALGKRNTSKAIQYLTSLPDEADISRIPHTLLKSKLRELITEASKLASITRRGAGLSIMVHRIVSSDMKKGKPLFHYFMNMILDTCSHTEDLPGELHEIVDIDNEKDLPKAIYIHFLTRIVVDSSIASDVMFYSPQLAKLAFDNLTSSHWQIRNAALQLYGALVPKLLGQKKASGTGEETIATVACDEIRTHSPKLWIYINEQLKNVNTSDKLLSHSILIPILNMLANCAMRYNFSSDPTYKDLSDSSLLKSLIGLLDSPIFTVRRLAAKSIFNVYPFQLIYDCLKEYTFESENFLHGVLLTIAHCYKYYGSLYHYQFHDLQQIFQNKLTEGRHSYLCKELYEHIFEDGNTDMTVNSVENTLAELDSNVHAPGIYNWANERLKRCILKISWNDIPSIVKIFIHRNELDFGCKILLEKLKIYKQGIPKEHLLQTSELLISYDNKFNSSALWRTLYEISQLIELNLCTTALLEVVRENSNSYKLHYMLPLIAKILSNKQDENNLDNLTKVILTLSDPETVDIDMRYIAALSNNELSIAFNTFSDDIKIRTITSAVILLQDEDEDVRNLSTIYYKNAMKNNILYHPYICLQNLLDYKILHSILKEPKSGVQTLKTSLLAILSKPSSQELGDNYNPFANISKNIYVEVEVLQNLIESSTDVA